MRYSSGHSLALVLLVIIVSLSDEKVIAPDNKKLYHDIVSGLGLYNNFEKIYELTTSNFKNIVYNTDYPKTWLVEFYNSWCGHCHRFAPIYKGLAVDVYNWRDVVGIGAVDCANDKNNQLCRDYEIMAYPSLKIFPIYSPDTFLGDTFPKGSVSDMRLEIAKQIHAEDSSGRLRQNLNLRSFNSSDLNILWFGVPLEIQNIFLVFQHPLQTPYLGSEVTLDLYPVKSIQVRTVNSDNNGLMLNLPVVEFPTVYVIERNNNHYNLLQLRNSGSHRDDIYYAIKEYLAQKGVTVPVKEAYSIKDLEFDVADVMKYMKTQEEIKKKLQAKVLADVVFQVDLEGALKYSLYHEISGHKNIDGEKLVALKDYLTILSKYFPIGNEGKQFLESLRNNIEPKSIVYGQNFSSYAKTVETMLGNDVFLPDQNWIGCQGSQPHFRGYPCSLWKLFHTLTVQADSKKYLYPAADSQEVLNAMVGYITHFFGCSDCSQHFQQMAITMPGNVTSVDTSILWLWHAHNAANSRLHGDATEDPEHQKVQFPSQESCPKCRQSDSENWKIPEVLDFLKSMYTNISYIQWSDISDVNTIPSTSKPLSKVLYSKSLRHESYSNENGFESHDDNAATKSSWDFNIFDISLCVVLYVTSVVILLLVCIKFVMKKSYKKKNSFDLYHSKV